MDFVKEEGCWLIERLWVRWGGACLPACLVRPYRQKRRRFKQRFCTGLISLVDTRIRLLAQAAVARRPGFCLARHAFVCVIGAALCNFAEEHLSLNALDHAPTAACVATNVLL